MSTFEYGKACQELREHIILLLEHFDNQDEAGWGKLLKIAQYVVKVDYK